MSDLAVMIATPLPPELVEQLAAVPGVRLLHDPAVLPAARFTGDISGDPDFTRDDARAARWQQLLGEAEVVYGIPGNSGEGLVELLRAAPQVRWVQARNAG